MLITSGAGCAPWGWMPADRGQLRQPVPLEGKSGKNDMTDAAAICEAASRPTMRFVPIKSCGSKA